jgi:hypothetical protein
VCRYTYTTAAAKWLDKGIPESGNPPFGLFEGLAHSSQQPLMKDCMLLCHLRAHMYKPGVEGLKVPETFWGHAWVADKQSIHDSQPGYVR